MRGGQVLDRRELFWEGQDELDPATLLAEVLPQIYDTSTFIPKEVHLPVAIEAEDALADWLSERKGERVLLLVNRGFADMAGQRDQSAEEAVLRFLEEMAKLSREWTSHEERIRALLDVPEPSLASGRPG